MNFFNNFYELPYPRTKIGLLILSSAATIAVLLGFGYTSNASALLIVGYIISGLLALFIITWSNYLFKNKG